MSDKDLEKTQKALQELIKVEYMAIAAYDEAIDDNEDGKLRRQYSRFRGDHERQARDLNNRLVELGGDPVDYDEGGAGKNKAGIFGKIAGLIGDQASIQGMRKGAEDGINRYLGQLDNIHDSKALGIIRRNLESKQDEVRWLEQQVEKEQQDKENGKAVQEVVVASGKKARKAADDTGKQVAKAADESSKRAGKVAKQVQAAVEEKTESKKTGLLGVPVWLLLAVVGAAAFFFLRRQEEPDFSDEAFQYETTDFAGESTGTPAETTSDSGSGYHGIADSASGDSNA